MASPVQHGAFPAEFTAAIKCMRHSAAVTGILCWHRRALSTHFSTMRHVADVLLWWFALTCALSITECQQLPGALVTGDNCSARTLFWTGSLARLPDDRHTIWRGNGGRRALLCSSAAAMPALLRLVLGLACPMDAAVIGDMSLEAIHSQTTRCAGTAGHFAGPTDTDPRHPRGVPVTGRRAHQSDVPS